MSELTLRNQQRRRRLDLQLLRRIAERVLYERLGNRAYEIGLRIVSAPEMEKVNQKYLQHRGSTDVITFSYTDPDFNPLRGDIFICIDDTMKQARQFQTSWQAELVRYFIHGVLHLQGYDDLTPNARRVMKREENRLLKEMCRTFPLMALRKRESI